MEWDNKEQTEKDYPLDKYEHVKVKDPDEAQMLIANAAFTIRKPIIGQCRWYSENEGVVIFNRSQLQEVDGFYLHNCAIKQSDKGKSKKAEKKRWKDYCTWCRFWW